MNVRTLEEERNAVRNRDAMITPARKTISPSTYFYYHTVWCYGVYHEMVLDIYELNKQV